MLSLGASSRSVAARKESAPASGKKFLFASLLVLAVLAMVSVMHWLGSLSAPAWRLLMLLFVGQWLLGAVSTMRGKTSLFIDRAHLAANAVRLLFLRLIGRPEATVVPWQGQPSQLPEPEQTSLLPGQGQPSQLPEPERTSLLPEPERTSLLFWIVKLVFIPFMITVATNQTERLLPMIASGKIFLGLLPVALVYSFWLMLMDLLDTAIATIGYSIESDELGNRVRSVDTSLLGWVAALLCYPPLNSLPRAVIPVHASPFFNASGSAWDIPVMIVLASLATLFTLATLNLNVHFSNLCHRGLVTSGLYSVVRHPAYATKLLSWAVVIAYITGANPTVWAAFACWVGIYATRAITEERHLSRVDPEYAEYCKRVRYRFIPGLI
ncbi:MAG: isoprenylcysteine carboxylmethyltransferase family protein [Candidatus Obscuribacterales bacterium]